MRSIRLLFFLIILMLIFVIALRQITKTNKYSYEFKSIISLVLKQQQNKITAKQVYGGIGERIAYYVQLNKFKLGSAVFNYVSQMEMDGKTVNYMTFETKIINFRDLEKIYSDPESFLPLKVERDISSFANKERIIEDYDQDNFILTITKFKRNNKEEIVIKKDGVINNAILLPFYVRNMQDLGIGWTVTARLPTRQYEIKLVSREEIKTPAGTFDTYHFESLPKKFEIWISADERRIPVKIKEASGLEYTMIMKEYSKTNNEKTGL
jgi:hypothetical protein